MLGKPSASTTTDRTLTLNSAKADKEKQSIKKIIKEQELKMLQALSDLERHANWLLKTWKNISKNFHPSGMN
jgi:hypothetical protein